MKSNDIFRKGWAALWVSSILFIIVGGANLMAQDAELIAIGKEKFYSQNSASGAVLEEFEPYRAFAFIGESSSGSISADPAPTLTPPGLSPIEFEFEEEGWDIEGEYDDKATLDAEAPNGAYAIDFTGATQGMVTGSLAIEGDAYPNAPSLTETSFNDLQSATLSNGITLKWVPFQNGNEDDFIIVFIEEISSQGSEDVFESELFDISWTETTFDVPAGILTDGGGYEVCIEFINIVDDTTIGGARALAVYITDNCIEFGDTSRKDFQFSFFQDAGSFNEIANNQVTTNIFPLSNQLYNLSYTLQDDAANFPDKSLVTFGAPTGSPYNGAAANDFFGPEQGEGFGNYITQSVPLPADASGLSGTYSTNVSDAEVFSKDVDFSSFLDQNLVAVPTVNLNGDNTIQSIDIEFRTFGNQEVSSTAFIRDMRFNLSGTDFSTIYEEFNLPGNTTNIVPPTGINWSDVQGLNFFYFTELGSSYHTSYDKSISAFNTFEQWASERIPDSNQRGLTDDPGGNGVSNLLAYAFGMPPLSPDRLGLPVIELLGDTLNVDHQRTPNTIDLIYTYEVSPALLPDSWMAVDPVSLDISPGDTEFEDVHVHFDLAPDIERLFFRVVVTRP